MKMTKTQQELLLSILNEVDIPLRGNIELLLQAITELKELKESVANADLGE